MNITDFIVTLKVALAEHGNIAVKVAGENVTEIEVVPAEEGFQKYLDIVGA